MAKGRYRHGMLVFISKSGESDKGFIEALAAELDGRADVSYEDVFRLQATTTSYQEVWEYQLNFWPRAQVIVALLTGRERLDDAGFCGLPYGMGQEVLSSIWGGKQVIFCATVLVQNFNWLQDMGSTRSISYTIW
ncbi:MAG: hypothetical protein H0T60_04745 [Acidobacteria bacterium]|nr:hypothetical protein [Acidobacteriota bacterium]